MRICGDINEIRKSHRKQGPSLGLSGKYEKELVDVLKNAFLNAKKVEEMTAEQIIANGWEVDCRQNFA